VGTNGAAFGWHEQAQFGVQPVLFFYRTPNFQLKYQLPEWGAWSTSVQAGAYYLLEMASRAVLSPMYSARIDNPDYRVFLFPVGLSASRAVSDGIIIHQTLTALGLVSSGALQDRITLGYSAVAEFLATDHHALLVHLGEVGFWSHDHFMVGASYRWLGENFEARLGYFYRVMSDSAQAAPLIALGYHL
jgi:hypothetical protein